MSLLYVILALLVLDLVKCQSETIQKTLANIPEDGLLNFTQLSGKYGHPAEEYDVTTQDGYILKIFHIPGDKNKPVLFLHGVFDSSDGWILRGNTSLIIIMANEGYDIWLINFRGNRYSRNHKTLDPDEDNEFWDFSGHEYATYDLPACIDFILNVTGQQQLSVIGFSEGTTATFILGATQVEYNDKVKMFIGLAPVAYLDNVRPALSIIITLSPFLNFILPASIVEVTGYYSLTKAILNLICTQLVIGYELCYLGGFNLLSGVDKFGIEKTFFPTIMGHFPAGTSRKNLFHFAQISLNRKFAQYDYGTSKNLMKYKAFTPPAYDLTKMTMKTVLVSGENDPVSTLKDVEILKGKLSNVVEHKVLKRKCHNHLDHLWAKDAHDEEYRYVLDILAKYT